MLPLGSNFFALSSNYQKTLLDESYYLVKHANFTYYDVKNMPTFERKFFIDKLFKEFEKRNQ